LRRRPDIRKAERQVAAAGGGALQEAVYEYQKSVLEAFEETEGAIASFRREMERNRHLSYAFKSNDAAYDLTLQLYDRGIKDRAAVIVAQRERIVAEDLSVQSDVGLLLYYVALYKAQGGAW
jgi:outer membrane protein TolC